MTTVAFDLKVKQGETYGPVIVTEYDEDATTPISNAGCAAKLQIRASATSDTAVVTLTDGDGITLGGADGTTTIRIGADKTATLTPGKAVYDLRITNLSDPTDVRYPIAGDVFTTSRVTR